VTSRRQDREAERRRLERQAQRRGQRAEQRRRRLSVVAAVLAGLVVLGGVLFLTLRGGDDAVRTETAGDTEGAQTSAPSGPASDATCTEPPDSGPGESGSYEQPELTIDESATYTATLQTNCGEIGIDLLAAEAPTTVNSFRFLAEEGFYAGTACHRLTTEGIFVLQCGDPTGSGSGSPGYEYGIENAPEDGVYPAGTVAMARASEPESNGSQFFIVYEDTMLPTEGGGYTIFGQVTEGLDVVAAVAAAGAEGGSDGPPVQPISLESVTVTEGDA
jgi:peptidyl-prolyl cis-trans isomerase B (cyclophilin B)